MKQNLTEELNVLERRVAEAREQVKREREREGRERERERGKRCLVSSRP